MVKKAVILVLLMLLAASNWSDAKAPRTTVRKREGDYNVSVAGFIKGDGYATLAGTKISVLAQVKNQDGTKGSFVADNLTVDGNHFSGTGTAMGTAVIVRGRVDAPEFDAEKQLKLTRITATIASSDGKFARLVGSLPGSDKPVAPVVPPSGPRPPVPPGTGPKPPPRDGDDDVDAHRRNHPEKRGSFRR